jgi:hypothetical protein
MADPIFLPPGLDLTVFMVPYNGGRLVRQGFTYVEFVEEPQRPDSPSSSSKQIRN